MGTSAARLKQVDQHYERAVKDLVDAHAKLASEPLVLAAWFRRGEGLDVHLLEVIEDFPGADTDPPFAADFGPSGAVRILGTLYLTLLGPGQLRHALRQAKARPGTKIAKLFGAVRRDGQVVYRAPSPRGRHDLAASLARELGLS